MKKILSIVGIAVLGLLALSIAKDQILRQAITTTATAVTGAPTQIKHFSLRVLRQVVHIKGFKMYNPEGFPREVFIDIPEVEIDLNVGALLKKKIHLQRVTLDLNEITVIKNKEGVLNVDALKIAPSQDETGPKAADKEEAPRKKTEQIPLQIDELNLNLGRVIFKDYTKGDPPKTDVYEIGLKNKQYKNITSAQQLMFIIMSEPLKHTAIQGAKIFAAQAILGAAFLPAGVAVTLTGKDSAQQGFDLPYDKVYDAARATLQAMTDRATIKNENKEKGTIVALVDKNDVTLRIDRVTDRSTQITVSARRLFLPKPEVARGVIYQISQRLK